MINIIVGIILLIIVLGDYLITLSEYKRFELRIFILIIGILNIILGIIN